MLLLDSIFITFWQKSWWFEKEQHLKAQRNDIIANRKCESWTKVGHDNKSLSCSIIVKFILKCFLVENLQSNVGSSPKNSHISRFLVEPVLDGWFVRTEVSLE
jgi:hypothetical protein